MMLSVEEWTQELDTTFIANRTQLLRVAYKILGDWERSDDVVQDAYIKITEMEAAQKVRQPLAYLFQIVRNLAIDHYRRVVFESELFGVDEEGLQVPTLAGTPETHAINRQHLELVAEALAKLPDRTKRVFELYRIHGYTHRMIADELGISPSLANILIHEATNHCRNAL
ncbi:RNA polymerase factor sigma-70 [Nitrosomonas sp. Is37]|uniref:RNA polymerase factor sigma-70 n=1 Tax=Nitrosomonas sp. Is37 TaxID=3080535 RepID=UPI00294B218E|nr:RNA polymerase factor sigma-70 [Nitrosomonas sp. Is37]MDV6344000.1 RNA polymerase factor sigma-70 [Nitrosomonas sp. Is37]